MVTQKRVHWNPWQKFSGLRKRNEKEKIVENRWNTVIWRYTQFLVISSNLRRFTKKLQSRPLNWNTIKRSTIIKDPVFVTSWNKIIRKWWYWIVIVLWNQKCPRRQQTLSLIWKTMKYAKLESLRLNWVQVCNASKKLSKRYMINVIKKHLLQIQFWILWKY